MHAALVGKPEGERQLRRPRRRWEDDIKLFLEQIVKTEWINLAEDWEKLPAVIYTVTKLCVP
jgi:hypothetical protein